MLRYFLLILFFAATEATAEQIKEPMRVLDREYGECSGAGFFLWDSARCLFKDNHIFLDGRWIQLTAMNQVVVLQKKKSVASVGDKYRRVFVGKSLTVRLDMTLLPAKCSYTNDQCEFRNYLAHIVVVRPHRPVLRFDGVGYSGA